MATKKEESLVLVGKNNGMVIIPAKSPLTRLNYFDGKFLRASDLKAEQDYLRQLVRLSNQAGGSGVVHGFDLTLGGGDTLDLGPGLGISGEGRVVLLPQEVSMSIQELIDKSQELQKFKKKGIKLGTDVFGDCVMAGDTPPVNTTHPSDLYLITICPADALCGEEDVYGKLCEEACATSTDRPYAVEGVIVRAVPLELQTPLPHSKAVSITSKLYLRSRVASAYFEDERQFVDAMISASGLAQQVWCLGAEAADGKCLPLGVLARAGGTTLFLDPWIPRRERMDTPPRRYWQWRMMMRPWDVFLAQILQFQCQLSDIFDGGLTPGQDDPCGDARSVIGEAAKKLADFVKAQKAFTQQAAGNAEIFIQPEAQAQWDELESMSQKLTATEQQMKVTTGNRLLIRNGIIELPSAGYLPVAPGANMSVNKQVEQLMGEGVDLRFCIVRPDFVAHALEEAQHMERISLIQGLEDPKKKPQVDILIPEGELIGAEPSVLNGFAVDAQLQGTVTTVNSDDVTTKTSTTNVPFKGVAGAETLASGRRSFSFACSSASVFSQLSMGLDLEKWRDVRVPTSVAGPSDVPKLGIWLNLLSDDDLLSLQPGDKTNVSAEVVVATSPQNLAQLEFRGEISGELTLGSPTQQFPIAGDLNGNFSFEGVAFTSDSGNQVFEFFAKPKPGGVELQLSSGKVSFAITADWADPQNVQLSIKTDILTDENTVFEIDLTSALSSDQNVFTPTDSNHVRAVEALEFAAVALNNPTFVTEKSALLFPSVPETDSGNAIRATHDWVLFHRRRNKDCDVKTEPKVTVCQTIFRAKSRTSFTGAVRAIEEMIKAGGGDLNAVISEFGLVNLGDVLFEERSAKVAGDGKTLNDVVTAWKTDGAFAAAAAVYSHASPQDEQSRTDQATAVLLKINNLPGASVKGFTLPPAIALPTACPAFSIVMPVEVKVEETCLTVIQVLNRDNLNFIRNSIAAGDTNIINTALAGQFGPNMGVVTFKKGTTEVLNDSLAAMENKWNGANPNAVIEDTLVVTNTSATTAERTAFQNQTALVRQTFGGTQTSTPALIAGQLPAAVGCPALAFVSVTLKP